MAARRPRARPSSQRWRRRTRLPPRATAAASATPVPRCSRVTGPRAQPACARTSTARCTSSAARGARAGAPSARFDRGIGARYRLYRLGRMAEGKFTATVRVTGVGRLLDFRERFRYLMVRDIDATDYTEHHTESAL